jgi:TolA-binding protein
VNPTKLTGRVRIVLALALVTALGGTASAQSGAAATTSADIQRLQDNVYEASRDVNQLRSRDASLASQLQGELDDARDEAVYLKVKLRKNERIDRNEYADLRDRIDGIRNRARGDSTFGTSSSSSSTTARDGRDGRDTGNNNTDRPGIRDDRTVPPSTRTSNDDIPVGTEFDVRLSSALSSATAQVEDRFEATTVVDLRQGNRVVVPAGSVMRGVVSSVKKAGRIERTGSMTVAFDRLTIGTRSYPIRATVTDAIESEGVKGEAGKIGAGAGVGAVIGAILGGAKGALAGILIGGGGTIAATDGKDVELKPGTLLRVRMDSGLNVR